MKRKTTTLIMSAILAAAMAAGCGNAGETAGSTGSQSDTAAGGTESEVKGESSAEETVLTFMAVGGSNEQAFTDVIKAAADKFNAGNEFNAKINLEWYENEQYKTKLATLMTQNDVTDIFFTWEAGYMKDYVESEKVYSLSDALKADPEWMERFNDGAFDAVTYNDKIYAVPMGQAIIPIYYNTEIFAQNNLEVPKTWDEFVNVISTLKCAGVVPLSMACQDFQELVSLGAFPESFLGLAYDEGRTLFTSEKAAMYSMGTWDTSAVIEGMGGPDKIGVFMMPAKNPDYNDVHIASVEKLFAISEKCDNKEAALGFIKMLSDPEIQEKYVVDCGALSATNTKIDTSKVDPVTAKIMELQGQVKKALTPMDRQFGANVGGEFNNISLAIAGGKDPQEQFAALQSYAEQEADQ